MYSFLIKCPNVNIVVYGNLTVESNLLTSSMPRATYTSAGLFDVRCLQC